MLEKVIESVKENKSLLIASTIMTGIGLLDSSLTLNNIKKYGINFEGNPLIKMVADYIGVASSLYGIKIVSSAFAIGVANKMNSINYKIKGEWLLYGASLYWSVGAISNFILK